MQVQHLSVLCRTVSGFAFEHMNFRPGAYPREHCDVQVAVEEEGLRCTMMEMVGFWFRQEIFEVRQSGKVANADIQRYETAETVRHDS